MFSGSSPGAAVHESPSELSVPASDRPPAFGRTTTEVSRPTVARTTIEVSGDTLACAAGSMATEAFDWGDETAEEEEPGVDPAPPPTWAVTAGPEHAVISRVAASATRRASVPVPNMKASPAPARAGLADVRAAVFGPPGRMLLALDYPST